MKYQEGEASLLLTSLGMDENPGQGILPRAQDRRCRCVAVELPVWVFVSSFYGTVPRYIRVRVLYRYRYSYRTLISHYGYVLSTVLGIPIPQVRCTCTVQVYSTNIEVELLYYGASTGVLSTREL